MIKIKLIIYAFIAATIAFFYFLSSYRGNKIDTLETQKKELQQQIKDLQSKYKECQNEKILQQQAAERANNTIGEIKTVIKTVKSPCACYDSSIDSSIIDSVRGNK